MCSLYFQTWKALENEMGFDMFVTELMFQELLWDSIIFVSKETFPVPLSIWQFPDCPHLKVQSNLVEQTKHLKIEND